MFSKVRRFLFGAPLPTDHIRHTKLPKYLALPVFASDALSSTAYATQEILMALMAAGAVAFSFSLPIAFAIACLLFIVALSYRQTIHAYPSGGGSYIVTKDNLGVLPGLIAAGALLIDYVLTVAVSIAAGVDAVLSAWRGQHEHLRVTLCCLAVLFILLINLRGAKESGTFFAIPTYGFIASLSVLLLIGFMKPFLGYPFPVTHTHSLGESHLPTGIFLVYFILRAFAAGCTALTGIEAVSDGVPAFRPPESKNAANTLSILAGILICLFIGITYLSHLYLVVPDEATKETVISQLTRRIMGSNHHPFYYIVQSFTALILVLAANTSFQDFPRLSYFLARDKFMPRQLAGLGDRLVFANGMTVLSALSLLLLILFRGDTHALLPLYALGVFTAFTCSQSSMVKRHLTRKEGNWLFGVTVNGLGALTTGVVAFVIAITKFSHGAYITLALITGCVFMFLSIRRHYENVSKELLLKDGMPTHKNLPHTAIVLVPGVHKGVMPAIEYARSLAEDCRGIYIELDPSETPRMKDLWEKWSGDMPLIVLESPYRSLVAPISRYLDEVQAEESDRLVTIVIPEFVPQRWWHGLLHNQSGLFLKFALLFKKKIVVTNIRYALQE